MIERLILALDIYSSIGKWRFAWWQAGLLLELEKQGWKISGRKNKERKQ